MVLRGSIHLLIQGRLLDDTRRMMAWAAQRGAPDKLSYLSRV